jgi:hypothetical protein
MQGWLKNGARMTVAVTAFAAAGAGMAYAHESSPAQLAGHTAIELTALQLPAGGPLARQFGQITGIGGPLGCMSYIGKPAQTVHVPADEDASDSEAVRYHMGVLGTDTDEEYTNPDNIPGSDEDNSSALGAGDTDEEYTNPDNIPAADQDDQMCTSASTASTMPSGHHPGTSTSTGKHHHGTGTSGSKHHGTGAGSKHHGTGSSKGMGKGKGRHGRCGRSMMGRHHMTGGKPASTGARRSTTATLTASTPAASSSTTLPTTGAPMAALLGLAVAALAAGLVARRVAKRGDEAEPEEG